jgi:hypothetical protein
MKEMSAEVGSDDDDDDDDDEGVCCMMHVQCAMAKTQTHVEIAQPTHFFAAALFLLKSLIV